jgi:CheY-like chemotaxis protein
VLHEMMELMSVRAEQKNLTLSLHVTNDVPSGTLGDPGRIRQVLLNIVANALKFTETGEVRVVVTRSDAALRFAVSDTGVGLTPDEVGRLFQHFTQADASTTRRFGGTGLGLAICKRLVESMGGTIGVVSRKAEGSTFWFTVPAAPAELPHPAAPVDPSSGRGAEALSVARGRAPRVLLAEDNVTNQFLAKRLLTLLGCAVDVAANGHDAVELWTRQPYDVIVMDCQMPEMDGLAAAAEIRRREQKACGGAGERTPPHVPIIACSAGVTASERERCLSAGMDDFVPKPLSRDDLRRALQDALEPTADRSAA